jgi:hypothetical protein
MDFCEEKYTTKKPRKETYLILTVLMFGDMIVHAKVAITDKREGVQL